MTRSAAFVAVKKAAAVRAVRPNPGRMTVEELNNRIRVGQRRNCGLGEADYLRLKALTCLLPL
jgi:hypothetical protein